MVYGLKSADCKSDILMTEKTYQLFKKKGCPIIVAVTEGNVFALCSLQPCISGGTNTPVLPMDHLNLVTLSGIFVTDGSGFIRGTVINED